VSCELALPEMLFDIDFPSHYKRNLRSVSVIIQYTTDPFANINCTRRLLAHKSRNM
jgi:hypothetical protein